MFGNDFFDRREDRQQRGEMRNHGGTSDQGHGTENFASHTQSSFQNTNWNGLSPRNRENQAHYQRVRESPPGYESEEWPESDIESVPLTRKRLGSPMPTNNYPTKRMKGQIESFADHHQMPPPSVRNASQHYFSREFRLPPPVENNPRRSSWMGPDIQNGERWGSVEGSGFGHMSPQIPRQRDGYGMLANGHSRNDSVIFGGGSGAETRRGQIVMPDSFRSTYQQRGMTVPDVQRGYRGHQVVDLTTPESVHSRRTAGQPSTSSGSSTLRRVTETEPTDPENDYDSDISAYKSTRMQSYVPIRGVGHNNFSNPNSGLRAQSVMPGSGNTYPPQFRQNFITDNHDNSPFFHGSSRQSFNSSPIRHDYSVPRVPEFSPNLKTEVNSGQSNPFRGFSRQPGLDIPHRSQNQIAHRQNDTENDPESDDDETIEDMMRKKPWTKKSKAAENASRDIVTKRIDFGGSRRSASGYSSQVIETNSRNQEERHESTLSRIRGPDPSKTQSTFRDMDARLVNGDTTRHIVIKQTAAQKAEALEKNNATLRRQKQAEEMILQREKRAKELQNLDVLFEEPPVDEAAEARIKEAKAADKARKYAAEEARIVQDRDKQMEEELAASRKRRAAEEKEENALEKKKRAEEKRQQEKKREEERSQARRISATETLRLKGVMEEEARLKGLEKLEADRKAARMRAATLQSFKRMDGNENSAGKMIQAKETETMEDSGNFSDDGMFVQMSEGPVRDETPKQPPAGANTEVIDVPASERIPETITDNDRPEAVREPEIATVNHNPESVQEPKNITGNDRPAGVQKPETIEDQSTHQSAVPSTAQKPEMVADKEPVTTATLAVEKPDKGTNSSNVSNATVSNVKETNVLAPPVGGVSISAVVNDGRRRPPDIFKPRTARRTSPDPIRFTSGGRATQVTQLSASATTSHDPRKFVKRPVNSEESQTLLKLQKCIKESEELKARTKAEEDKRKKEWDARMKQLETLLTPQDREDIAAGNSRARSQKNRSLPFEAGKDIQPLSSTSHSKRPSLTSQINFVSTVQSKAKERKKAEEERLAKYEKDKASCRRRYDREIRTVLSGQGIELDDEKISKQVDEKMVLWEENRRKKERRESGVKDLFTSLSQQDDPIDAQQNPTSPTPQNTNEGVKDPEAQKEQQRSQAIRAGVEFLASQNKASSEFAKAASKFRVQDFDSDESEEDPDDELETQVAPAQSAVEASEEMIGDETLNPAALDTSIIPPPPKAPELPVSKTAFLQDIINPREEDIMHSYTVRHRAARENNTYDSVILGSFHNLEEANGFAQQKLSEFYLGPSTGKSETHTEDNLYLGQVTTNKDKEHDETVWVTREIVYIGDTANVRRGDIKPIIVPKVYNIIQVLQGEDGTHVGSIIATSSIKTLANKKAADQFLALSKPSRPRLDSMAYYNDEVVPMIRQSVIQADTQDMTVDFEGYIPDTERAFSISISENPVVGPLN